MLNILCLTDKKENYSIFEPDSHAARARIAGKAAANRVQIYNIIDALNLNKKYENERFKIEVL